VKTIRSYARLCGRELEDDAKDFVTLVSIRDNFAILSQESNDQGIELYISQCQQASHIVQDRFTCPWGGEFDVEDHVIASFYYQKWGHNKNGYG
jgi:hypothetical protein